MSPAVEARGIAHRYGKAAPALDGVDLAVAAGTVTALIGANGSGKTTLLRILAGILVPTGGTVRVLGTEHPDGRRDRAQRRRVSYVSQDPALDPEMTAGETLTLLAALHGVRRASRARRVDELGQAFGLTEELERRVDALSGGQRRRLHLAAGSIHNPELLCLDEPTAGLDPQGRDVLWTELGHRAANGRTTVIVSHDLAAIEAHAAAVCVLDRGAVIATGPPQELTPGDPASLAEAYRSLTGRSAAALEPTAARKKSPGGRRRKR